VTGSISLTEGGGAVRRRLPDAVVQALMTTDAVVLSPTHDGAWDVAPGRKVGVVRAGDWTVRIQPKVSIGRLVFLMGYARDPRFWQDRTVAVDHEKDLPEALGEALSRLATNALAQGLLHGYVTREESLPVLRGRLRVGDQITARYGHLMPLEVRYDDFTDDIAENQILLAALVRCLHLPISHDARRRLTRLRVQLADVSAIPGTTLPEWRPSRLNTRYHPALRLAEVILAASSFEHRVGDLLVTEFAFDMWRIYEDFVCTALAEALRPLGGTSYLQYRTHLDLAKTVTVRPDFVWTTRGEPYVVADAKYKVQRPAGFPDADLYQMLAYCTVLGLRDGHLIYAAGSGVDAAVHDIRGANVCIHAHTLDLDVPKELLLAQVDGIAARIEECGHTSSV
jgi:5-methylcytosine-specific restriction enzyme subunit McrC